MKNGGSFQFVFWDSLPEAIYFTKKNDSNQTTLSGWFKHMVVSQNPGTRMVPKIAG